MGDDETYIGNGHFDFLVLCALFSTGRSSDSSLQCETEIVLINIQFSQAHTWKYDLP